MENNKKARRQVLFWVIMIILGYTIWSIYNAKSYSMTVGFDDEKMGIVVSGETEQNFFCAYDEIESVELIDNWEAGTQLSGITETDFCCGEFSKQGYERYELCYFTDVTNYIVVQKKDGLFVYNCSTEKKTESSYEDLQKHI